MIPPVRFHEVKQESEKLFSTHMKCARNVGTVPHLAFSAQLTHWLSQRLEILKRAPTILLNAGMAILDYFASSPAFEA
jgi:hypothetical protein